MARDKRNRLRTIKAAYALVSSASGDWLYLTSSVRAAFDHYVTEYIGRGEPLRASYDRDKPETWQDIALHMWKSDVEVVPVEGGEIAFTLGRGRDITMGLAQGGPLALDDQMRRILTDEEIAADPEPLHIVNVNASTEYR